MGQGVALDHQPGAAAAGVLPIFAVAALGIVADEDIVVPGIHVRGIAARGAPLGGIAEDGELLRQPLAAIGTVDQHPRILSAGWAARRRRARRWWRRGGSGRADRRRRACGSGRWRSDGRSTSPMPGWP